MRLGYEGPLRTDRQGRVIVLTKAAACRGRATEALTATPRERALSAHPPAIRWFRRRKRCTTRLHGGMKKRSGAVSIAYNFSIDLLALTIVCLHHAQLADLVLCDRFAADPTNASIVHCIVGRNLS